MKRLIRQAINKKTKNFLRKFNANLNSSGYPIKLILHFWDKITFDTEDQLVLVVKMTDDFFKLDYIASNKTGEILYTFSEGINGQITSEAQDFVAHNEDFIHDVEDAFIKSIE